MGLCAFFVRPFLSQGENNSFFFFCLDLGFIFTSVQLRGCSFIYVAIDFFVLYLLSLEKIFEIFIVLKETQEIS